MSFPILLQNNTSAKNVVNKQMVTVDTLTGTLKENCDVSNPRITIKSADVPEFNYFTIPVFNRSYYKTSLVNIGSNLWEIGGRVDVLTSFKNYLAAQTVILQESQETGIDKYVNNPVFLATVKTKTDIVQFPSGLLDNGEFILVTAGGLAV